MNTSSISGSLLESDLRNLLSSLGYASISIVEALESIATNGTATDCESIEPDDRPAVNAMVARHTGHLEYASAADWPSLFDEDVWNLDEELAPVPSAEPFEPSPEDRAWLATNDDPAGLVLAGLMPIAGGAPDDASPAESMEASIVAAFDGGSNPEGVALVARLHKLTSRLVSDHGLEGSRAIRGSFSDEDMARRGAVGRNLPGSTVARLIFQDRSGDTIRAKIVMIMSNTGMRSKPVTPGRPSPMKTLASDSTYRLAVAGRIVRRRLRVFRLGHDLPAVVILTGLPDGGPSLTFVAIPIVEAIAHDHGLDVDTTIFVDHTIATTTRPESFATISFDVNPAGRLCRPSYRTITRSAIEHVIGSPL